MNSLARTLCICIVGTLMSCAIALDSQSAQAAIVKLLKQESKKSAKYMVEGAEGSSKGDAIMAARHAAIVYAAKGMTGDRKEKKKIARFAEKNMADLVGYSMKRAIRGSGTSDDGERLSLKVVVHVQTKDLRLALVDAGALMDDADLADEIGSPKIMLMYGELLKAQNKGKKTQLLPFGEILTDRVIAFFTDKGWDNVHDSVTQKNSQDMRQAQSAVKGIVDDPNAELALASGAEMYIRFELIPGDAGGRQVTASMKAIDTVTAQVLATSVRSSKQYDSSTTMEKVASEALQNTLPDFFEQIRGFWQRQAKKGRKYMFVIKADAGSPLTRDRQRAIREVLKELGKFKRGTRTETHLDGILTSTEDIDDITDDFEDGLTDAGFEEVRPIVTQGVLFMYQVR